MCDLSTLQQLREQRFFSNWDEFLARERIDASESIIRQLIDELLAAGSQLTELTARQIVHECVQRFNKIDDGWICTIEREDIYEEVGRIIDACGFTCEEDWLSGRDW
jgi:hypothetical protein